MSATGFADTKPLVRTADPPALVRNRRVEIVVLAALDNAAGRAVADARQLPRDRRPGDVGDGSPARRARGGTEPDRVTADPYTPARRADSTSTTEEDTVAAKTEDAETKDEEKEARAGAARRS